MDNYLLISDAAKAVCVESHVLRYWEEELQLPIKRNELGHRYYTKEDVERFKNIKDMKERGLQLKAIKMILKNGKLDMLADAEEGAREPEKGTKTARADESELRVNSAPVEAVNASVTSESREEKAQRLQWIMQQMIKQAVRENNDELVQRVKESVIKELDYQFRMQEEREEERARIEAERSESYYRRMDELLRKKSSRKSMGELIRKKQRRDVRCESRTD